MADKMTASVGYERFMHSLKDHMDRNNLPGHVEFNGTKSDKLFIGTIFNKVCEELDAMGLSLSGDEDSNFFVGSESLRKTYGTTRGSIDSILSNAMDHFQALVNIARIPANQQVVTMELLANTLIASLGTHANINYFAQDKTGADKRGMESVYPKSALTTMSTESAHPSHEMFGIRSDDLIPDVRLNFTVALVKYHKSLTSKLFHRRPTTTSVITYELNFDEFFDLSKSQNMSSAIRNSLTHRYNYKDLLRHPDPVQMELKRVEPLKSKDPLDTLVADGIIRFDKVCNLWDTTLDADRLGYDRVNYTDLLSERISVEKLYFSITRPAGTDSTGAAVPELTEQFEVSTGNMPKAFFQQALSNTNSSELALNLNMAVGFHKDVQIATGAVSEIFKDMAQNESYVMVDVRLGGDVHKQEGNVVVYGTTTVRAVSGNEDSNVPVDQAVIDLAAALVITLDGYTIDARYSEENLRKVSMAARSMTNSVAYDLPQGIGIVVDHSLQQSTPEHVLDTAQSMLGLGIDHRNIQMTVKVIKDVHAAKSREINDANYRVNSNNQAIDRQYISANRVNHIAVLAELDAANVMRIRDSDLVGDIRQYVDGFMSTILANVHAYSLYTSQIDANDAPTYKVLTSTQILENLIAVPNIHAHLSKDDSKLYGIHRDTSNGAEYIHELRSGVRLECSVSSFATMNNQILMVPCITNNPASELNFAHNWDGGQFTVNFTPTDDTGAAHRRIYMSQREWVIPTCPIAVYLTIKNLNTSLPGIGAVTSSYLENIMK